MPPIGFYVHHHGHGHVMRAQAILPHLKHEATVLTSAEAAEELSPWAEVIRLPSDAGGAKGAAQSIGTPPELHYAPVGHGGLRARMAYLAAWAERAEPALLVVDVSAEVALFGRLCSLPVVFVRQHGTRTDAAHALAYRAAAGLLAPYPEWLEEPTAPEWVRARTCYAGGFSRYDGRRLLRAAARQRLGWAEGERAVVVLNGGGGAGISAEAVCAAAAITPAWRWTLLGASAPGSAPPNVHGAGWVADPFPHLKAADVVVAAAGDNAVMEVAAAGRPFICLPEERPFGEQHSKARLLEKHGAALTLEAWPPAEAWPALLRRARAMDPAPLKRLADGKGAVRAAAYLDRTACRFSGAPQTTGDRRPTT